MRRSPPNVVPLDRRRLRGRKHLRGAAALLVGAAMAGGLIGASSELLRRPPAAGAEHVSGCSVVDGDTLRCGRERVRLLGIDAPELPGQCRRGRRCAPGDPYAATRSLRAMIGGALRIERVGRDGYGRTLALVSSDQRDLSCHQLQRGHAMYRADWDDGRRLAHICPAALTEPSR